MRISDWSSDVCSSDLLPEGTRLDPVRQRARQLVDRCARIRALLLPVRYLLLLAASLDAPAAGLSLDSQAPSSFGVTQPAADAVRTPPGVPHQRWLRSDFPGRVHCPRPAHGADLSHHNP